MRRRRGSRPLALLAAVTAGTALAACGSGSSSYPAVFPTDAPPGLVCPALAINGPALLSPAPGSTAGPQPHTTYTVTVKGTLTGRGCSTPFAANDGTFTTQ